MENEKCNILIVGILSSGSSALVDLLSEYNNVNLIPREFDDFRATGLVADQLSYQQSIDFPNMIDTVIRSTSKKSLIYNIFPIFKLQIHTITQIKKRYNYSTTRLRQLLLLEKLNLKLKSNTTFEEKIKHANNWIKEIGNTNFKNKKFVVYNQPLETGIEKDIWTAVFDPYKLICVIRDPKDQLADIIRRGYLSASYGAPFMTIAGVNSEVIYGRNRKGAFKFHLDAIKKRMDWIDSMKKKLDPDKFLLLDFEGLVYNYEMYKSAMEDFIGDMKGHHTFKNKFFNPKKSKENTGIYKNILTEDEIEQLIELDTWYKRTVENNRVTGTATQTILT